MLDPLRKDVGSPSGRCSRIPGSLSPPSRPWRSESAPQPRSSPSWTPSCCARPRSGTWTVWPSCGRRTVTPAPRASRRRSPTSSTTSVDAIQRRLNFAIVVTTLLAVAAVIADLASGGRADPPTLRGSRHALSATACNGSSADGTPAGTSLIETASRRWEG